MACKSTPAWKSLPSCHRVAWHTFQSQSLQRTCSILKGETPQNVFQENLGSVCLVIAVFRITAILGALLRSALAPLGLPEPPPSYLILFFPAISPPPEILRMVLPTKHATLQEYYILVRHLMSNFHGPSYYPRFSLLALRVHPEKLH